MDRIAYRLEVLFCSPQSNSNKQISVQQFRSDQFLVFGYLQAMVSLTNTPSFNTYPDWLITTSVAMVSLTNTHSFSTYPDWLVMTIYRVAMVSLTNTPCYHRPGFTRLNLPYFISEEQLDFVLQAVAMVTEHGWKLLPQVGRSNHLLLFAIWLCCCSGFVYHHGFVGVRDLFVIMALLLFRICLSSWLCWCSGFVCHRGFVAVRDLFVIMALLLFGFRFWPYHTNRVSWLDL